jgi:hypothetical protein
MAYKKHLGMHNSGHNYDNASGCVCGCSDGQGNPKKLYSNHAEAKNAMAHSALQNTGISLDIYNCPKGRGYHLKKV